MRYYFHGAGYYGKKALSKFKLYYPDEEIVFIDSHQKGEVDGCPVIDLENAEKIESSNVIITFANLSDTRKVCYELKKRGCNHIYYYLRKETTYGIKKDFLHDECINISCLDDDSLLYAEMHVCDYCNLNCRGCCHFSPLFGKSFPDLESRMKDIEKLSSLFKNVFIVNLMGGEPLLNPQLKEYIIHTRKVLPDSEIWLTTNGLLIPKLDEEVLRILHDNCITVSVSEYAPTKKIIEDIVSTLSSHNINYGIRHYDIKQNFSIPLANNSVGCDNSCISDGCVNICDGKISRCPQLMYVSKLNSRFNLNYPTEGVYDLEEQNNGSKLLKFLEKRIPLCDFCINQPVEWSRCSSDPTISDFVNCNS